MHTSGCIRSILSLLFSNIFIALIVTAAIFATLIIIFAALIFVFVALVLCFVWLALMIVHNVQVLSQATGTDTVEFPLLQQTIIIERKLEPGVAKNLNNSLDDISAGQSSFATHISHRLGVVLEYAPR